MKKLSSPLSAHALLLPSCVVEIRSGHNPSSYASATSHDQFAVGESSFQRRFSTYPEGNTNSKPTGKNRHHQTPSQENPFR